MENLRDFFALIRRRWVIVLWCSTLVLSVACIAAFGSQAIYRSSGTILIEKPDIAPELARSTVVAVLEQQLELVSRRVMRSENFVSLIDDLNLYPDLDAAYRSDQLRFDTTLEQVDPITLEPKIDSNAFSIHFNYPDPAKAREVARRLVDLFIADNRAARTESAAGTEEFFQTEADRLADVVALAGDRLAQYKSDNQGLLPEDISRNQQLLERLREERIDVQANLRLARERRNLLVVQHEGLAGGTELSQLKAELAVARQKYSEDHPDIRRLTRAIAALESSEADTGSTDPELQRVSAQLAAVEQEIAAYEQRDRELQRRMSEFEGRLVSAPDVEKELSRLTRDFELASAEYEEIRRKQSEARIGSTLEIQDKSERYTVIREPGMPQSPIYPNRLAIFFIGILLAFGGSAAIVALRESADPTVRGTRDLTEIHGSPPLANIPVMRNAADRRKLWRRLAAHGVGFVLVVTATIGLTING